MGDDRKVDYIFLGSDDELNALELYKTDEDQAGTDDNTDVLDNLESPFWICKGDEQAILPLVLSSLPPLLSSLSSPKTNQSQ